MSRASQYPLRIKFTDRCEVLAGIALSDPMILCIKTKLCLLWEVLHLHIPSKARLNYHMSQQFVLG